MNSGQDIWVMGAYTDIPGCVDLRQHAHYIKSKV